jgi:carbamoyltransferase
LGVSAQYHDSAAALVVDGEIVAAAHEERFTRVKGDASLPEHAMRYVLRTADLAPEALTAVAFYESPFAKLDRIVSTQAVGKLAGTRMFAHSIGSWLPHKLWVARNLRDFFGAEIPVLMGDHHLSHAASAFYPSPHANAAILTVDGVGEWTTTSIAHGRAAGIELLEHIEYPNSLGMLYSAFTLYCGFKVNSGEYKLMGLAPYGKPRFLDVIFEELLHLGEDGSYSLNPEYFAYFTSPRTYTERFEQLFGAPSRSAKEPLTQHYADVAASIQAATDRVMLALAHRAKERTGERALCLAGGVALNVVSVGAIERSGLFDFVWVQPAAGDAGGALGAALWAAHSLYGAARIVRPRDAMRGSLLGPTPSELGRSATNLLASYGLQAHRMDDDALARATAAAVASGSVVAVAKGRMEYGPRALGCRSILADPRDSSMQLRLNLKTKFREGFRPFAPIVRIEDAGTYFEIGAHESPYMLKTYYIKPELRLVPPPIPLADDGERFYKVAQQVRSTLPAITHQDYSSRVQTVSADRHPFVYAVLGEFSSLTGCAVLVNTSFNVRGEPIVASAEDALECFLHTDVDVLVLEEYWIVKAEQSLEALKPRRVSARADD